MDLIKELKEEHVEIMRYFEKIKILKSNEKIVEEISSLKELLIEHLKLEDRMLYPALKDCENNKAKEAGDKFSEEMNEVSKVVLKFFDKYQDKNRILTDYKKFINETEEIIKAVSKRVSAEETILFPLFEKYVK